MADEKLCSIPECGKARWRRDLCVVHYGRWQRHGNPLVLLRKPNGTQVQWLRDHLTHTGDECLIWPFRKNMDGYAGNILYLEKQIDGCRLMCILAHGDPPTPKHQSAHSCGKGHLGCINPEHLSWKTVQENQADRIIHETTTRGTKHWKASLTESQVLEIRSSSEPQSYLAKKYGIGQPTVSHIKSRKYWAWL